MSTPPEPHDAGLTLGSALRRAARSSAGVRFIDRRERARWLSYDEILRRSERVAAGLLRLGLTRGQRVALILPTCPEFYAAFFGATLAGLVPVPLYPPVRLGRLEEYHRRTADMLRVCGARLVLTDARLRRILGPTVERARPRLGCRTLDDIPAAPHQPELAEPPRPDELAFIQFSSGTTSTPKPIRLTHRQILANASCILDQIMTSHPERDGLVHRGVCWLPLYHDMGLIGCVLVAVLHPGELTLIPPELFVARPAVWLRAISRYRGTVSPAPNFAYALCADRITDDELQGVDLSCWRLALNGAEPVTPEVLLRFVERFAPLGLRREALTPVYGLAEASLAVTFSPVTHPFRWRRFDRDSLNSHGVAREHSVGETLVSLGPPLPGFRLRVMDEQGGELPGSRVGRVQVQGPSVMQGYHGAPLATARALLADGWLDTGDLGFLHHGELYLYGRQKDVIILNGRNHAPQQVEQALDGLGGVRPGCVAAVGLVPPGEDGERLLVLVERSRTSRLPDDALADAVRSRVSQRTALVPHQILVLEPGTLPRTSSGKIRRSEARRLLQAGRLEAPRRVTVVGMLRQMWRSRLAFARARLGSS